jgi:hypothetical protein
MKTKIYIGILLLALGSCKEKKGMVKTETVKSEGETVVKNNENAEVKNANQLKENKGKNAVVYGTIIREEFINKGGRATGNFETLIKLEDGETVHIRNKGENKYNYEELANKKVKMEAVIFYGNIDSDNPEHQSRVGYRIDYTTITVLD